MWFVVCGVAEWSFLQQIPFGILAAIACTIPVSAQSIKEAVYADFKSDGTLLALCNGCFGPNAPFLRAREKQKDQNTVSVGQNSILLSNSGPKWHSCGPNSDGCWAFLLVKIISNPCVVPCLRYSITSRILSNSAGATTMGVAGKCSVFYNSLSEQLNTMLTYMFTARLRQVKSDDNW